MEKSKIWELLNEDGIYGPWSRSDLLQHAALVIAYLSQDDHPDSILEYIRAQVEELSKRS